MSLVDILYVHTQNGVHLCVECSDSVLEIKGSGGTVGVLCIMGHHVWNSCVM